MNKYDKRLIPLDVNVFALNNFLEENFGENIIAPKNILLMEGGTYIIFGKGPIYESIIKNGRNVHNYLKNLDNESRNALSTFRMYTEQMYITSRFQGKNKRTIADLENIKEKFQKTAYNFSKYQRTKNPEYLLNILSIPPRKKSEIEKAIEENGLSGIIDNRFISSFPYYMTNYDDSRAYAILEDSIAYYKTLKRPIEQNQDIPDKKMEHEILRKKLEETIDSYNELIEDHKIPKKEFADSFEKIIRIVENAYNIISNPDLISNLATKFPVLEGGFYDPSIDMLGTNGIDSVYHEFLHVVGEKSNNKYVKYFADKNQFLREFSTRVVENAFKKSARINEQSNTIPYMIEDNNYSISDDPYETADMFTACRTPKEIVAEFKALVDSKEIEQYRK
ncbi:MAG: hypothetical protein J7K26_01905 [Candidatus Aenigmarchaeota archaeon]|nr:hypothetical protein [Candidatus Aenigmarchaeota archaeon]